VPILGQPRRRDELPGFQRSTHGDDRPERAGKDCGEAINGEGGRYGSERQRHDECGELDRVMERRALVAAGMTVTLTASVTVGVTDVITMISSALRRM
jgi:hypothetical protein